MADVPVTAWDETDPADDDLRSLGDDEIRELKTQIQEIMEVDHEFESSGQDTDWGYHNKVTLVEQSANPDAVEDSNILFTKETSSKSELYFIDEDGNNQQLTSGGEWIGGMVGEVRIWVGTIATIPTGWSLCDGFGWRPNLINRFVRGIDTAATEPGDTGGASTKLLRTENMPTHTHTTTVAGAHSHNVEARIEPNQSGIGSTIRFEYKNDASTYTNLADVVLSTSSAHSHTMSYTGSVSQYDNVPVYYESAYIIKT